MVQNFEPERRTEQRNRELPNYELLNARTTNSELLYPAFLFLAPLPFDFATGLATSAFAASLPRRVASSRP